MANISHQSSFPSSSHTAPELSLGYKRKLVESFEQFRGNTVSQESLGIAKQCVDRRLSTQKRYSIIEFDKYRKQNADTPGYLTMMTSAYDLLLKYVINLLKQRRPQVWRSIKTNNTAFKARVACMKGAEEILRNAGYTEARENSMCFPDSVNEPDKAKLSVIAAELLMAKLEVEELNNIPSSSPRQQRSTNTLGTVEPQRQQTEPFQYSSSSQQFDQERTLPFTPPSHMQTPQYSSHGDSVQPQSSVGYSQPPLPSSHDHSSSSYGSISSTGQHSASGSYNSQAHYQSSHSSRESYPSHSTQPDVYPGYNNGSNYSGQVMAGGRSDSHEMRVDPASQQNGLSSGRQGSGDLGTVQTSSELPTGPSPVPRPRPRKPRTMVAKCLSNDKQPSPGSHSPRELHLSQGSHSPSEQPRLHLSQGSHSPSEQPRLHHSQSEEPLTSLGSHKSSSGEISIHSENSPANSVCVEATDFLKKFREDKKRADEVLIKKTNKSGPQPTPRAVPVVEAARAATSIHALQTNTPFIQNRSLGGSDPELNAKKEGSGYKLPPKKKQPSFYDDPILEDHELSPEHRLATTTQREQLPPLTAPRVTSHSSSHGAPPPPLSSEAAPQFCSSCKNKLSAEHRFCSYCGTPASPRTSHPITQPPEPIEEDLPPLRASHNETLKAEESHRKTHVLPAATQAFTPVYEPHPPPQRPPKPVAPAAEPALPPRPKPRQTPTGPPVPRPAWEDTTSQTAAPPVPPKAHPPLDSGLEGLQAGASGSSSDSDYLSEEFRNMPGIKFLLEKERAYKQKQRKDGVREQDLKPLLELEDKKQEFKVSKTRESHTPKLAKRKEVDLSKFPAVDTSLPPRVSDKSETRRIDEMARDGRALLHSLKECVPLGYSLDEIQIAYNQSQRSGRSLYYLQTEWKEITEQAQRNLSLYTTDNGCRVGTPSAKEMREALAKAGGDRPVAESSVFKERQNRVKELLARVAEMRRCNENIPELTWDGAVQVLSANGMDVDTAYYVLQSDWLKPLYDYIFDEKNKNVLVNKTEMEEIKKVITNKDIGSKSSHCRLLMAECKFPTEEEANTVLRLLQEVEPPEAKDGEKRDYPLQYFIEAAKDHEDFEKAKHFLIKECAICYMEYPVHEFVAMPGCIHSVCKECFRANFMQVISTQEVKHFTCPVCGEPDMANQEITEGFYLQLFLQLIKEHLDKEHFDICDKKLIEFNLLKDPNFIWCANTECRSGFIHEGRANDIACPNCHKSMCRKCKKQWEPTHEGISCDAFARWKIENDPDAQEQGLAAHLQANGIECPGCHFKYDLAKGGCMHFKCGRCPNEFCSGCGQPFKNGLACGKFDSCKTRGLHAHHPRDCLFYMRDFDVQELQEFLKKHNVAYDTQANEAPAKEEGEPAEGEEAQPAAPKGCIVMLQKETPGGLKDEECGGEVMDGHAGLCLVHYKEYLVDLINRNKLDPITMYTTTKVQLMLTREEMPLPEKDDDDDDDINREKLIEHVKKNLPLPNKGEAAQNPPAAAAAAAPGPPPDPQPLAVDAPAQ